MEIKTILYSKTSDSLLMLELILGSILEMKSFVYNSQLESIEIEYAEIGMHSNFGQMLSISVFSTTIRKFHYSFLKYN